MSFKATARYVRISPYKVRPIVDAIRGKGVKYAGEKLRLKPGKAGKTATKGK